MNIGCRILLLSYSDICIAGPNHMINAKLNFISIIMYISGSRAELWGGGGGGGGESTPQFGICTGRLYITRRLFTPCACAQHG